LTGITRVPTREFSNRGCREGNFNWGGFKTVEERVFKNNELANGAITYKGEPVNFEAIVDTPLLTVEGADDDICGLGQTEAAQTICKSIPHSKRKHYIQQGAGHYGIFSGSKFRKFVRPLVTDFIHKYV